MAFCGECEYFTECWFVDETDAPCDMFYPNFYMEVNHQQEWRKYHQYLVEKRKKEWLIR